MMPARAENAARPLSTPEERAALQAELEAWREHGRPLQRGLLRPTKGQLDATMNVLESVCWHFDAEPVRVLAGHQAGDTPDARAVCCAVLRRATRWQLEVVAAALGMSATSGVKKAAKRCETRPDLQAVVKAVLLEVRID